MPNPTPLATLDETRRIAEQYGHFMRPDPNEQRVHRLAQTATVQGDRVAAALALHAGRHNCTDYAGAPDVYEEHQTCPTAEALGVTP